MMTKKQIEEMLNNTGIEYRYHHFEADEAINPPFICWLITGTDNFLADGKVYLIINELNIELYTDEKDFELEKNVEKQFDEHKILWNKTETYIESENMYKVLYEMEA